MDDVPQTAADRQADDDDAARAELDPRTTDPRVLMQVLLPAARREYIKAWEWLADAGTPLDRRRAGRTRATAIAEDHALVAAALRERERTLTGDDLLNARHLAEELERHVDAYGKLASISPMGLHGAGDLRPEALGCGKRYRDPSKVVEAAAGTRGAPNQPRSNDRDARGRGRGRGQGSGGDSFGNRGAKPGAKDPKPPRDALGSSKHDSALGDDMDPETRAKLEDLRKALEG